MAVESKIIVKKEKEARKLEVLEAEVLKRLRDTHVRQQQAYEQIQEIFSQRKEDKPSFKMDHLSQFSSKPVMNQYDQPHNLRASRDLDDVNNEYPEIEGNTYEVNVDVTQGTNI
jgi:hypothetical protein